jgi:hypothetical protein
VLLQIDTVASSTAIPLLVKSQANEVFRVSPNTAQIYAVDGTTSAPTYSFANDPDTGIRRFSTNFLAVVAGGSDVLYVSNNSVQVSTVAALLVNRTAGTASDPDISFRNSQSVGFFTPAANQLAVSCSSREIVRWKAASSGGGWHIMDEADSDPTTTELDSLDSFAVYAKNDKLVFAYNNAGTINYITIPFDGSTSTWTNSSTAP